MSTLILENVDKRFGAVRAVAGISLTVLDRELAVLVGPSGCGKTSTLRMIAGLDEISGGLIRIDGQVVNDLPTRLRDVAFVFQNYSLYQHMSVRQNLGFGLKVRGAPKREIAGKVKAIAEALHIEHLLDRNARHLSGGEKQRVAIGRALVRNPRLFLMDEPLSNLDAKLRLEMRAEIKRIQRNFGATSVYVTHDQAEAMSLADRLIVMKDGRIVQEGRPLDVYQQPAHMFVAQFLGNPAMNLIPGGLIQENGRIYFQGDDFSVALPEGAAQAAQAFAPEKKDSVWLGVRPRDLYPLRGQSNGVILRGQVQVVESLGDETLILVEIGQTALRIKTDDQAKPIPGDILELGFESERLHFFHGPTGRALNK